VNQPTRASIIDRLSPEWQEAFDSLPDPRKQRIDRLRNIMTIMTHNPPGMQGSMELNRQAILQEAIMLLLENAISKELGG